MNNYNIESLYQRVIRPTALLVGLTLYVLLTWWMLNNGYLRAAQSAYLQLTAIWVLGFVALVLWPGRVHQGDTESIVFCRASWCNIGVVIVAALVPDPIRMVLLIVPLFGVLYAALHLSRSQVISIALVTLLVFVAGEVALLTYADSDTQFVFASTAAFAAMLSGIVLLSWEMIQVRLALQMRNVEMRQAMERVQDLASRDELTNLNNRRFIMEILERQRALADRGQEAFAVCYCDLDHFKQVNDKFGHAVGDVVLKQFARLSQSVVRNVDYIARFGGEEFLLVLVDADEAQASDVARRLAERTRQLQLPDAAAGWKLTVSIGVTCYRRGERIDDLLLRADHALYDAKKRGRDRVVISERKAANGERRLAPMKSV